MASKTWASFIIPLAAVALLATGCSDSSKGGGSPSTAGAAVAVPGESAEVNAKFQALYKQALAGGENKVVVYRDACTTEQLKYDKAFSDRFAGIAVECVPQAVAVSTSKIQAEASAGQRVADVYLAGSNGILAVTQDPKLCAAPTVFAAELPKDLVSHDGRQLIYGKSGFGFIYNTDKVSEADAPKSWSDLLAPRWKGKLTVGSPLVAGGPRQVLANMLIPDNQEKFGKGYLTKLAAQDVQLTKEAAVASDVASGRFEVGLIVIQSFYTNVKGKGGAVGFVFPMKDGNYLVQLAACRINGAPHANAADLYVNWLFSGEGQELQATILGAYGALPDAPGPAGAPSLKNLSQLARLPVPSTEAYEPYYNELKQIFH